ncbi:Ig-like domain-containing protein [Haloglomus litoreum]|uniref:Ig-like domain-containing protein n=1 Tax=Haloglomus litoreum TaxID=3034026 RepID=UPI0023E8A4AC|nr:Ig-like domain-containing protein [Haloglomus sp. DT116]
MISFPGSSTSVEFDRGQAVVLGAILVFALAVAMLALYQLNAVPQQDRNAEFDAYQGANVDMIELHNELLRTARTGGEGGANVKTGVSYPFRPLSPNPPPGTGSLRLSAPGTVTVSGAVGQSADVADFWDGATVSHETHRAVFTPGYNRLDVPPVVSTGYLAYRQPEENDVVLLTGQSLVRQNRISLILLDGELATASETVALSVDPVSTGQEPVAIVASGAVDPDNDGRPNVVLTLPTDIPADVWETELLAGEENVEAVTDNGDGTVDIRLRGVTDDAAARPVVYELRMAKLELRKRADQAVAPGAAPTYLVATAGDGASILDSQTASLTVQVRDELHNPVTGAEVNFQASASGGDPGDITPQPNVRTDQDGFATVVFDPDEDFEGTVTVDAECESCVGDLAARTTSFTVQVSPGPETAERPPSVEIVDVWRTSGPDDEVDRYTVQATVDDPDGNLVDVTARLASPEIQQNPVDQDDTTSFDKSGDTVTLELVDRSNSINPFPDTPIFTIRVTVQDEAGLFASDTTTVNNVE